MSKITIITVCYNAEEEIEKTMGSVCDQNYEKIEYLVIDGKSTDRTLEIAQQIKEKNSNKTNLEIQIYSEQDSGIYDAMNKGIEIASGEWILFMNAGDSFYSNDVISKLFLGKDYTGVDAVYGDTVRVRGEKETFVKARDLSDIKSGFPLPFCHQAVFVRSTVLKEEKFDLRYKQASDYNFFCKFYLNGKVAVYEPVTVCYYLMGGLSETNTILHLKEKIAIREELELEKYSSLRKLYLVKRLEIRQVLKRILPKCVVLKLVK